MKCFNKMVTNANDCVIECEFEFDNDDDDDDDNDVCSFCCYFCVCRLQVANLYFNYVASKTGSQNDGKRQKECIKHCQW